MRIIRWLLGTIILSLNWVFTPRSLKRDPKLQALINQQTAKLTLYQYKACPFCVKVRRALKRQALAIQTRDAKRCEQSRKELLDGGGQLKVPCLKVEDDNGSTRWIYESSDIISYLSNRFSTPQA
ncbi:MAG: glutathione S-transferase N-terminal domain-containing protein [Spongiibacteraceae bacterium]